MAKFGFEGLLWMFKTLVQIDAKYKGEWLIWNGFRVRCHIYVTDVGTSQEKVNKHFKLIWSTLVKYNRHLSDIHN
jgi:hypothetical protein